MILKLKQLYRKIFISFKDEFSKHFKDCNSVLDIACGSLSPIRHFSKDLYAVGVDIFEPSIKKSRELNIHNDYIRMNVMNIDNVFSDNLFDCVIAIDLIEHFEKKEALELLKKMENIAKKKVIVFTPNGFLPQGELYGNKWQKHISGWTVKEMEKLGYNVIGINGWKALRGNNKAELNYCPKIFWKIVSDITQIYFRNNPKNSFQLLCVKNIV